ncbi:DUF2064 domain-containing protein [Streptomyces sp. XM4193]|uniref:TIGR04282 family arsenosugar biosynthesis glycosyltransferase n=1 Tax=Streptomyces sp. XM4193 TaxID=2929782 RepID=UPI001FFC0362|nr:DUF2064 domain-containing protein [Streptomyces sp. XM4193]MCK1798131.1 DUF2064 domain-containing protein [Streptomyces sp. XM4193]
MTTPAPHRRTAPAPHTAGRDLTVLVIAKEPVPGRVKTRLTPCFTAEQAALLAGAALADTLATVRALPCTHRIVALQGQPGPWLPDGFEVVPQGTGGLDERIERAFARCVGPTLLLGMDTPQLHAGHLAPLLAADAWESCDAWYGPATDGGFWALALREPRPGLVRGVPMSRPDTGALQRSRLTGQGLRVADLPALTDVDTAADAADVAPLCSGEFAAVHRALLADRPGAEPPAASGAERPTARSLRAEAPYPAAETTSETR